MDNGPFEDVFPIKNGDILACYVSSPEGIPIGGWYNPSNIPVPWLPLPT